tara:strand:+ start:37 stop:582 length:546 start_codon:yes stop_codon:yes gene_type:complete
VEILIREKGGEPRWIDIRKVLGRTRTAKTYSSSPPTLKEVDGFEEWYELYNYKKGFSKARTSWRRHVKKEELVEEIMIHTKKYVASTPEKQFRKHPTTYLNQHTWNDEITEQEVKYDLKEYPRDTTGFPRAWCSKCGNIDTYYEWELNNNKKGSKCCNTTEREVVRLLPFDPKKNKGNYGR